MNDEIGPAGTCIEHQNSKAIGEGSVPGGEQPAHARSDIWHTEKKIKCPFILERLEERKEKTSSL